MIVRSVPAVRSAFTSDRTDFFADSNSPLLCSARPQQPCLGTSTSYPRCSSTSMVCFDVSTSK